MALTMNSRLVLHLGLVVAFAVCTIESLRLRVNLQQDLVCLPTLPVVELPSEYETCAQQVAASKNVTNPDMGKKTEEIARYYGYTVEIHNVTTADGYILTVHRLTGGPVSPPAPGKPSVYVHHGMMGSSDNWLFQTPDRNLPFKLVDAGYDVWLTNCRGTSYSLNHTTLNSATDVRYWDFSWHEMAMNDIPATMDKITEVSGNEKMFYVGYSMGTTVYFISLSAMSQLNSRIIASFLLSPVAYNGHASSALRLLSPALGTGSQYLLDPVLRGRIDQHQQMQAYFNLSIGDFCVNTAMRCGVCDNALFALFGFDTLQMNYTNLPNILSKFPNIVSIKTLVHYTQSMNTCQFRQFDYGLLENLQRYGSITPPAYDLTKITAKTYFYHGDMDNLAVPQDVEITRSHMLPGTVIENYHIEWPMFNHLDFQIAKDADTLVYNRVVSTMNSIPPQ